jgi:hypothetical protein
VYREAPRGGDRLAPLIALGLTVNTARISLGHSLVPPGLESAMRTATRKLGAPSRRTNRDHESVTTPSNRHWQCDTRLPSPQGVSVGDMLSNGSAVPAPWVTRHSRSRLIGGHGEPDVPPSSPWAPVPMRLRRRRRMESQTPTVRLTAARPGPNDEAVTIDEHPREEAAAVTLTRS